MYIKHKTGAQYVVVGAAAACSTVQQRRRHSNLYTAHTHTKKSNGISSSSTAQHSTIVFMLYARTHKIKCNREKNASHMVWCCGEHKHVFAAAPFR